MNPHFMAFLATVLIFALGLGLLWLFLKQDACKHERGQYGRFAPYWQCRKCGAWMLDNEEE